MKLLDFPHRLKNTGFEFVRSKSFDVYFDGEFLMTVIDNSIIKESNEVENLSKTRRNQMVYLLNKQVATLELEEMEDSVKKRFDKKGLQHE